MTAALAHPNQLKQWLQETGREFVVLNAMDLVDALPWPGGVETFMQVLDVYKHHRMGLAVEHGPCPRLEGHGDTLCTACGGRGTVVTRAKGETLEPDETDAAIRFLERTRHGAL